MVSSPIAGLTTFLPIRATLYLEVTVSLNGVCMGVLSRIGIAIDSDLLKRFDLSIKKSGYANRSEAFRDLIRDRLVGEQRPRQMRR